jgi:hypothetical protein
MKKVLLPFLAAAALFASAPASATVITTLNETFASGAQFTGNLTFSDNYVDLLDVDGTLTGANYGTVHFGWTWYKGDSRNSNGNAANIEDWLMQGDVINQYTHFIGISWVPNQATLTILVPPAAEFNNASINYTDAAVSARTGNVPEPASLGLMGLGMLAIGALRRRRQA